MTYMEIIRAMISPEDLEHFRIFEDPEVVYVVNFSGGASSGFMLACLLTVYGGTLPANVHVCFCNTGMEDERTLVFVHRFSVELIVRIWWLEYRRRENAKGGRHDPKNHFEVVGFNSASRNGEPFEQMLKPRVLLPNIKRRFCTTELKVSTIDRFVRRELKEKRPLVNVIGFRADEPSRIEKYLFSECRKLFPMALAKVTRTDVLRFWSQMTFRLELDSYEGNCKFCFMKRLSTRLRLIREQGEDITEWWARMEDMSTAETKRRGNFNKHGRSQWRLEHTVREQVRMAKDGYEPSLFEDDDQAMDCFCGD